MQDINQRKEYDEEGTTLNNVEKSLEKLGIKLRDSNDTFRSMGDVIDELAGKWNNFTQVQQADIAKSISGVRQRENFLVLMNHYSTALELEQKQLNASGNAMERYGAYAESTEAKLNDLSNTVQQMWMKIISSDTINSAIGFLNNLTKGFSFLTQKIGLIPTVISAVVTGLSLFKKEWMAIQVTSKTDVFGGTKLSINSQFFKNLIQGLSSIKDRYVGLKQESIKFNQQMGYNAVSTNSLSLAFKALTDRTGKQILATIAANVATTALSAAYSLGLSFAISLLITGISKLIDNLINWRKNQQELINQSMETIKSLNDQKKALQELSDEYTTLKDKEKNLTATTDEKKRLLEVQEQLVEQYKVSASGINAEGKAFADSIQLIQERTAALDEQIKKENDLLDLRVESTDEYDVRKIEEITKKREKAQKEADAYRESLKRFSSAELKGKILYGYITYEDARAYAAKQIILLKTDIDEWDKELFSITGNREKFLNNYTDSLIENLEKNGKKVSNATESFVKTFVKTLVIKPESLPDLKIQLEEFFNKLTTSRNRNDFDKLVNKYNDFKLKKNSEGLKETSSEILKLINTLTKGDPIFNAFTLWAEETFSTGSVLSKTPITMEAIRTNAIGIVEEFSNSISTYNEILEKASSGQEIFVDEILKWQKTFPDIFNYLNTQNNQIKFQEGAIEALKKAKQNETVAWLEAEKSKTNIQRDELLKRLENYKVEANVLNSSTEDIKKAITQSFMQQIMQSGGNLEKIKFLKAEYTDLMNLTGSFNDINDTINLIDQMILAVKTGGTSGGGKGNKLPKSESFALIEKDRYMILNAELAKTNGLLEKNKALQNALDDIPENYQKRIGLLKEEQELLKKKQEQTHLVAEEMRKERDEIVTKLKGQGISFKGIGDSTQAVNAMNVISAKLAEVNKHRNDKDNTIYNNLLGQYNSLTESFKRFIELQTSEIPKASAAWWEYQSTINDIYAQIRKMTSESSEDYFEIFEDVNKQVIELLKERYDLWEERESRLHEDRLEMWDDEKKAFEDYIETQIDLLDELYDKEDFEKELGKETEKALDIQKEINKLSLDDSFEAQSKIIELKKELGEQNEKIEEIQTDRSRKLQKQNLEDIRKDYDKNYDEKVEIENDYWTQFQRVMEDRRKESALAVEAEELLMTGSIQNVRNALTGLFTETSKNATMAGQILQTQLLDRLTSYRIASANLSAVSQGKSVTVKPHHSILGGGFEKMTDAEFTTYVANKKAWDDKTITSDQADYNAKLRKKYGITKDLYNYSQLKGYYYYGGEVTENQIAMLHGSKQDPEWILTKTQLPLLVQKTVSSFINGMAFKQPNYIENVNSNNSPNNVSLNFNIQGNLDKTVVPKIENIAKMVIEKINDSNTKRGFKRNSMIFNS